MIKTILALKHQWLPPSLHFVEKNPDIDFADRLYVNTTSSPWESGDQPRRAGVSSFGIGGTNAHAIIEEAPLMEASGPSRPDQLLLISARTPAQLDLACRNLARYLDQNPEINLADVAYTLQMGRRHFAFRRAVVCGDREEAVALLNQSAPQPGVISDIADRDEKPVAFLFSGQGSQYLNMAAGLYKQEQVFRETIHKCARILMQKGFDRDLQSLLFSPAKGSAPKPDLRATDLAQPALFAVCFAQAKLLMSWGIVPCAMAGHSIGEYVAATLAGVFSLEDALGLVAARGRMMQNMPMGAMLSLPLSEADTLEVLGDELSLAAVNGPSRCVVSGPWDAVTKLETILTDRNISSRRLVTSHAFHSSMMKPLLEPFSERVSLVTRKSPKIPILSNLSGTWMTDEEAKDPHYWARHLGETVRFDKNLSTLLATPQLTLLEVGPGRTLTQFARTQPVLGTDQLALPSLPGHGEKTGDVPFLLECLARLWARGTSVDWEGFYRFEKRRRIPLPTYPFERQRYWIEPQEDSPSDLMGKIHEPDSQLQRQAHLEDWFSVPTWKRAPLGIQKPEKGPSQGCFLVFPDSCGLGEKLARRLRKEGNRVVTVRIGNHFRNQKGRSFRIDPDKPKHFVRLFEILIGTGKAPDQIVHLWNLTKELEVVDPKSNLNQQLQTAFYSLLYLAQAMGKTSFSKSCRLTVVANHLHDITGSEALIPAKATLMGPVLTIPGELPNLSCQVVDVEMPVTGIPELLMEGLLWELEQCSILDGLVAHRGSHRWLPVYEPIPLEKPVTPDIPGFCKGGVYLITGGLGGIGYKLATHLAGTLGAKLALLGRSAVPEEDETSSANHPQEAKLRALRDLGAQVLVVKADVADEGEMGNALDRVRSHFGPIRGVIHAAGTNHDGTLHFKKAEECKAVMDPKIAGTLNLIRTLKGDEAEFVLLCSTVSAIVPGFGQVDYAAANAFLDALARAQRGPRRIIAVNWCGWKEVGMLANQAGNSAQTTSSLENGITPDEGAAIFDRILNGKHDQVVVSPVRFSALHRHWHQKPKKTVVLEEQQDTPTAHTRPGLAKPYKPPQTETEQVVAKIWGSCLGFAEVGMDDDFLAMGGDSLLAIQILSRLRQRFPKKLVLSDLFEKPTVAELSRFLDSTDRSDQKPKATSEDAFPRKSAITPIPRDAPLPLAFPQERLWFINRLDPDTADYNITLALRLTGRLQVLTMERCFQVICRRHEILRTRFPERNGLPIQVIDGQAKTHLSVADLGQVENEKREAECQRLLAEASLQPFSLEEGPLVRVFLFLLKNKDAVLLLSMHHILADARSLDILFAELVSLYGAQHRGEPSPLPDLPLQYADFAHWQRQSLSEEVLEPQTRYWVQQLQDAPAFLDLPLDFPRPVKKTYAGAMHHEALPADSAAKIRQLCRDREITPFMALLSAFSVLLWRYSGQKDFCIGTPITGRSTPEVEDLIGFFVNTLVLRMRLDGRKLSINELLARVRGVALEAFAHPDLPFEQLVERLQLERDRSRSPLYQVMFTLETMVGDRMENGVQLPGLHCRNQEIEYRTAKFDLTLLVNQVDGRFYTSFEYNSDLFKPETAARMGSHYLNILEGIASNQNHPLSQIPMLGEEERQQILVDWNRTDLPYPKTKTLHGLFQKQARETPDAIALIGGTRRFTYAQLNAKANQLAHFLISNGSGPDDNLGLCLSQSPEMIIAMLAILKTGGAYVPIDSGFPASRIAAMQKDAGIKLMLVIGNSSPIAGSSSKQIDVTSSDIGAYSQHNPTIGEEGPQRAYVTYTSGSTGTPKGVMISHQNALRLVYDNQYLHLKPGEGIAQASNPSFDALTFEVWTSLLRGCRLCLVGKDTLLEPAALSRQIDAENITTIFITTALFNQCARVQPEMFRNLNQVLFGGEQVDPATVSAVIAAGGPRRFLHVYGPTESTTFATWYPISEAPMQGDTLPIGYPIGNTRCFILDADLEPVPTSATAPLYLGGDGLSMGYLKRPGLTAQRFIPDPFATEAGSRLYFTGDLARYRQMAGGKGAVEFAGRVDRQVKIRGFRIEPNEIEFNLKTCPAVQDAAIAVVGEGSEQRRLVAYVVPKTQPSAELEPEQSTDPAELKPTVAQYLAGILPGYMIPQDFVLLEKLPLNANGKIDLSALPRPGERDSDEAYVAPQTPTEEVVTSIWGELLDRTQVGTNANFFDIGGHSLLMARVVSRLWSQLGVKLPIRALFEFSTAGDLAQFIDLSALPKPIQALEAEPDGDEFLEELI